MIFKKTFEFKTEQFLNILTIQLNKSTLIIV